MVMAGHGWGSTSGELGEGGGGVEGVRLGSGAREEHHAERRARHSACQGGCETMMKGGEGRSETSEKDGKSQLELWVLAWGGRGGQLQPESFRRGVAAIEK